MIGDLEQQSVSAITKDTLLAMKNIFNLLRHLLSTASAHI